MSLRITYSCSNNTREREEIKQFGSTSLSYASLQGGLYYFRHPDFDGFIAFKMESSFAVVLGSPHVPVKQWDLAYALFRKAYPRHIFCQIPYAVAQWLAPKGLSIHHLGMTHILDCENFQISWKIRKDIKRWLSALERDGYSVVPTTSTDPILQRLNNQWQQSHSIRREYSFLSRPFTSDDDQDVQAFLLKNEEGFYGFVTFDPLYLDGKILSYELQHQRVVKDAPKGAADFLIAKAIVLLRDNDVKEVSLGLSPLYNRRKYAFKSSRFIEFIINLLSSTDLFYPYRGLGQHKDQWKAQQHPVFLAITHPFDVRCVWSILRVNNLI